MSLEKINVQGVAYFKIDQKDIMKELPVLLNKIAKNISVQWITAHWSAAPLNMPFKHYQVNVGDGFILIAADLGKWINHQHTWKRNTGNIGISFMAMGIGEDKDKYIIPTENMIECFSSTQAILAKFFKIDWKRVVDHAYFAKIDGYPQDRWDIQLKMNKTETLYDICLKKSKWYYEQ